MISLQVFEPSHPHSGTRTQRLRSLIKHGPDAYSNNDVENEGSTVRTSLSVSRKMVVQSSGRAYREFYLCDFVPHDTFPGAQHPKFSLHEIFY